VDTLAKQIEDGMHGEWRHCAIYERDLERFWPPDEKDRETKIAQFARKYGFRLRFYNKGNVRHLRQMAARKDRDGFDLISDAPPFGRLWYEGAEFFLLFFALVLGRAPAVI
jgi:hypothetical protein